MSRFLDCSPESFRYTKLDSKENLGLYGTVKQLYHTYLDEEAEVGVIRVGDKSFNVDPRCVAMLKAVLFAGCCRIEERADACRQVFDKCVTAPTVDLFKERLEKLAADNEWVGDVYKVASEEWAE